MSFSGQSIGTTLARNAATPGVRPFAAIALAAALIPAAAFAQGGSRNKYFPLDQNAPPGVAGQWTTAGRRSPAPCALQIIRVELPGDDGQVTFYQPDGAGSSLDAPAVAAVQVGSVYRLKLAHMAAYPGVELYPTVELLDRLHPPRGRETEFPIPVAFTEQEIRLAIQGRMVTKVLYLEQPDRAAPVRNTTLDRTHFALPRDNALVLADEAGRPMALVRLGARVPDLRRPEPGFFGSGGALEPLSAESGRAARQTSAKARSRRPGSAVQQVGYETDKSSPRGAKGPIVRTAADPRMPADCPACPTDCPTNCPLDERFPDEYLCDGGDHGLPVHYSDTQMLGLESEDTVVEFVEDDGKRRVKPSNKVCIYSPRFAAIVSISGAIEDIGGGRPTAAFASVRGVGLNSRDLTVAHEQREMLERFDTRERGSGLQSGAGAFEFDRPEAIHGHIHAATPVGFHGFLQTGKLHKNEAAHLMQKVQAAVAWTRNQNPMVAATVEPANELRARFTPSELVGQENRHKGRAKLRIVKLADKEIAAPGDVITFKIRFDNIGDRPVTQVVIVDNLTPRLEYVEDSATCTKPGEIITADNGEGSLILRWELEEPLAARDGGVITFQARVR
jgi:uncharacterized repeat protein (TIGR01451 family)